MCKKLLFLLIPASIALISILYYEEIIEYIPLISSSHPFQSTSKSQPTLNLFTTTELKHYNGIDRPELYLAVLGLVFDVTTGSEHYAAEKTYNFFIGKDASRNFINGKFSEDDASDDVVDLKNDELLSLKQWVEFYRKNYREVGRVVGKHYGYDGKLTSYGRLVLELIKNAEKQARGDEVQKRRFPPCNVEWDQDKGTRIWCTNRSGGISRDWVGFPRKLYEAGSMEHRCACVNSEDVSLGNVQVYDGCDSAASSCYVKEV